MASFCFRVPGQFGAQPRCPAVHGPNQSPNKEHQEAVFSKPIAVPKPKPRITPIDMMTATNMARQKGKRRCNKDKTIEDLKERCSASNTARGSGQGGEPEKEVKKQKKEKMEKGPSLRKKKKGKPQKGPIFIVGLLLCVCW